MHKSTIAYNPNAKGIGGCKQLQYVNMNRKDWNRFDSALLWHDYLEHCNTNEDLRRMNYSETEANPLALLPPPVPLLAYRMSLQHSRPVIVSFLLAGFGAVEVFSL